MTIYVDDAIWPYRGTMYCHMMTDGPIEELHSFATQLGLKRAWFQNKPSGAHYDVSINKRYQAIRLGAKEVKTQGNASSLCAEITKEEREKQCQ